MKCCRWINSIILFFNLYHYESNSFPSFLGLQPYAWVLWGCGLPILIAIWMLYVVSIRSAMRHWRDFVSYIAVILSVYPVSNVTTYYSTIEFCTLFMYLYVVAWSQNWSFHEMFLFQAVTNLNFYFERQCLMVWAFSLGRKIITSI